MITLLCPLWGCQTGTPGSIRVHSSLKTVDWMILRLLRPEAISSKSMAALEGRREERVVTQKVEVVTEGKWEWSQRESGSGHRGKVRVVTEGRWEWLQREGEEVVIRKKGVGVLRKNTGKWEWSVSKQEVVSYTKQEEF